jgi:hypothetical protein
MNRYRSFPPLQYARQDAEAIFNFLQRYRHLSPGCGALLTDVSPNQQERSTLPSRDNWWSWLQSLCTTDQLQPEDVLWVSFSGYGIHHNNEDYLIPWDGDPKAIAETGISVRSLLNLLHGARTSRILLMLDMSRSQGIFAPEQHPGKQTATLVTQFGVQTLLSCQPHQFAHETTDLRLGLFTSALLEGLRIHRLETLGELALYLSDRVPQLCDLHWKPLQIPLGIGSPGFQLYAHSQARSHPSPETPSIAPILIPVNSPNSPVDSVSAARPSAVAGGASPHLPVFPWQNGTGSDRNFPTTSPPSSGFSPPSSPQSNPELRTPDPSFQPRFQYTRPTRSRSLSVEQFLQWFFLALMVLGGVLLWQRLGLRQRLLPTGLFERPSTLPANVTDQRLLYDPLPKAANQSLDPLTAPEVLTVKNQQILRQARTLIRENQASLFSDAIAQVRQIQPGEPLYEQAQVDIDRWSQTIFDFALGRAEAKDYQAAIAAARLVPWDQAQYQDAQTAIPYWQEQLTLQRQMSRRVEEAAAILRPDSASSYSDAIALLRTIPAEYPDYDAAQELIQEWSLAILDLAQTRADQGNYTQAIAAARLVPQFSEESPIAQELIETWSQF